MSLPSIKSQVSGPMRSFIAGSSLVGLNASSPPSSGGLESGSASGVFSSPSAPSDPNPSHYHTGINSGTEGKSAFKSSRKNLHDLDEAYYASKTNDIRQTIAGTGDAGKMLSARAPPASAPSVLHTKGKPKGRSSMYAGMVGGSVSKIPLSSVGEDSNASGNDLTSARRFSVGKMNPGTATGNWRGRRQSAFHGVSFNAKVFDPKEQRVESIKLTLMGGIMPSIYKKIAVSSSDYSNVEDLEPEKSLSERRAELLEKLHLAATTNDNSFLTKIGVKKSNIKAMAEKCLWYMLPSGATKTRTSNTFISPANKDDNKVERGKRDSTNFKTSEQYGAYDSIFSLNMMVFPALENGKEIKAVHNVLKHCKKAIQCEQVQLVIIDPVDKVLRVAFSIPDARFEGYTHGIQDNVYEHTLLTGIGSNYKLNKDGEPKYPETIAESEKNLHKNYGFKSRTCLIIPVLDTNLSMTAMIVARNKLAPGDFLDSDSESDDEEDRNKNGHYRRATELKAQSSHETRQSLSSTLKPANFTYEDELCMASHGQTLTIVLHQCHIQEHLSSIRGNMDAVVDMVSSSSKEIRFSKTIQTLTKSAEQMIGGESSKAIFLVYDKASLTLRVPERASSSSFEVDFMNRNLEAKFGEGIVGTVAETREHILIEDAENDYRFNKNTDVFIHNLKVKNLLSVPISDHKGKIMAVLVIYNKPWTFSEADVDHMHIVAQCAGIVLRKAQMFQEVNEAQRMEQAISSLTKVVYKSSQQDDLMYLLKKIGTIVQSTVNCERVTMFLMDNIQNELWCAMSEDLVGVRIKPGVGVAGSVAKDGQPINITDAYKDDRFSDKFDKATGFKTKSILTVPIPTSKGEAIGVFQCVNKLIDSASKLEERVSYFNNKDQSILTTFSLEVAEVLNKHASQLQVMKAIADAHTEDFKKRRASSLIKRGVLTTDGKVAKNLPSLELIKRHIEARKAREEKERAEKEARGGVDAVESESGEESEEDSGVAVDEKEEGETLAKLMKSDIADFSDSDFDSAEEEEEEKDSADIDLKSITYDDIKLRRHSMLMRHHNVSHHSFNKFLLASMGKHAKVNRKSIFMPRMMNSVNEGKIGSKYLKFDPKTHTLVRDLEKWNFTNIFTAKINEKIECSVLMLRRLRIDQVYNVGDDIVTNFITSIAHKYRITNEYHNFTHAFYVMHMVYTIIRSTNICQISNTDVVAMCIAALCHDVDHPGTDNDFEINMQSDLAITYNDITVLENHHVATCFRTARMSPDHNIFSKLEKRQYKQARSVIIECILSTDMKKHFSMVSDAEKTLALDVDGKGQIVMNLIMHAADIGSLLSPPEQSLEWTERVMSEFRKQAEKCRTNNIAVPAHMANLGSMAQMCKLQVDFVDYIVAPIWNLLHRKDPKNLEEPFERLKLTRLKFVEVGGGLVT